MDSVHLPNGMGLSLSSVMSCVEPTILFDIPIITPSVLMQMLVLLVNRFFFPEFHAPDSLF